MRFSQLRHSRWTSSLMLATALALGACSSDDNGTGPGAETGVVGTWQATAISGGGMELIGDGMTLQLVLSSTGTYTMTVTNDLLEACGESGGSCTNTGPYSSTATTFTFDDGLEDEITFDLTVNATTMTWTGTIETTQVTFTFARQT